jgi:DNA-binding response OmpR family regulator
MRLLLVEDTQDVAEAIVASFARRGDAIDHAATAAAARDALAVQGYDVVILDINLPDGDGTELLRQLRREQDATPVLMLTARISVDDRVSALDGGADDYLVKPFDLRELEARVRALARRKTPERAGVIDFGDLSFDSSGLTVLLDGAITARIQPSGGAARQSRQSDAEGAYLRTHVLVWRAGGGLERHRDLYLTPASQAGGQPRFDPDLARAGLSDCCG